MGNVARPNRSIVAQLSFKFHYQFSSYEIMDLSWDDCPYLS